MAATSTYMTFLMHGTTSNNSTKWAKLIDIKEFPDLGGAPEMLETTTLSDKMQTYIAGIQSLEAMTFTANYEKSTFETLSALEHKQEEYAVWLGGTENNDGTVTPTGSEGKFSFTGELSAFLSGGGVNEVRNMTVTIAPSTVIVFDDGE